LSPPRSEEPDRDQEFAEDAQGVEDAEVPDFDEGNLKPSAMRGTEPLYGYVVAAEILVVAILNLTDTHGAGAPAHPQTALAAVGILGAAAVAAAIRFTRHRMVVAFVSIAAAFLVSVPKIPKSLELVHIFAIAIPFVYAFILTQRQNKARATEIREARAAGSGSGGSRAGRTAAARGAETQAQRRERRGRRGVPEPSGPKASNRYTPPKPKRPNR
jgi:hypothetical protein